MSSLHRLARLTAALGALIASPTLAQDSDPPPVEVDIVGGGVTEAVSIAVPPMPGGGGGASGRDIAAVIASDLRSTGQFKPIGPGGLPGYAEPEAASPAYASWRSAGAGALVSGVVSDSGGGRVTLACYLHDTAAGRPLAHQGFTVPAADWRRAAHQCADLVYSRLSGQRPYLDTRIVYVAETGPKDARVKRIAMMDSDGSNHRYLTAGRGTVISPQFSPRGDKLAYTSYIGRRPRVLLHDVASGGERLLVPGNVISFAPRFSPDGRWVAFSMAQGGNTDVYVVSVDGGPPRRLTSAPGADTSPSFSPDGRKIVFESDRSGTQQLYVMDSDGSAQRRISFGGGRYASPVWSPRGDRIAFTKITGNFRIGVIGPSGGDEKILTDSWQDEAPSWAPNGQFVMFNRVARGSGASRLYAVHVGGGEPRAMPTPVSGSDPSWSPLQN